VKVVFLDIDGVLNTSKNYSAYSKAQSAEPETNPAVRGRIDILHRHVHLLFDKELVERLNKITRESGAKLVVSSSWRRFYNSKDVGFDDLRKLLRQVGVEGEVVDRTPDVFPKKFSQSIERGIEIQKWLSDWEERGEESVTRFVILDDENDMAHLMGNLVRTDGRVGLSPGDVETALYHLRDKNQ
jgi:hypothetical protein